MLLIGEKQEVKSNRNFKKGNYVFLDFNLFEVLYLQVPNRKESLVFPEVKILTAPLVYLL